MSALKEIIKQINYLENSPNQYKVNYQTAQKTIDVLGGKTQLKEGDSVEKACYYITLLTIKKMLEEKG